MKNALLVKLVLLSFVIFFNIYSSRGQSNGDILLGGKVLNSENNDEISFANFIINDTRFGVVADEWGGYRILVNPGDSLTITAIGYQDYVFIVPLNTKKDLYKDILLIPTSYMLSDVNVYNIGTWEQFKQDFIHLNIEESSSQKMTSALNKNIAATIQDIGRSADRQYADILNSAQAGIVGTLGLSSSIGFSFGDNKAKMKEERRANLLERSRKHRIIAYKYNAEIVAQIIGEHEMEKVEHFMTYINTHASIKEQTTQLQIIKLIKRLYADYVIFSAKEKFIKQDTTV